MNWWRSARSLLEILTGTVVVFTSAQILYIPVRKNNILLIIPPREKQNIRNTLAAKRYVQIV